MSILNEKNTMWTVSSIPTVKSLKQSLIDSKTTSFVARLNKDVIGIVVIKKYDGRRSHVGEIGYDVKNEYRNSGVATLLIKNILKELKKTNIKYLIAWTADYNEPSKRMMKKFGFRKAGKIKNGVLKNGKYYDYILFQRAL